MLKESEGKEKNKVIDDKAHLDGLLDSITIAVQDYYKENKLNPDRASANLADTIRHPDKLYLALVEGYYNHYRYLVATGKDKENGITRNGLCGSGR